ncbi:MAG: hypothetical protein IJI25_08655 [Eubacterium sp.]|nr:hypothetical protein [Eubacterium sp.]
MPANYDGSIKIDTKLDNSGFDRDSDKLKGAVNSLLKTIGKTGDKINQTKPKLNLDQPQEAIDGMKDSVNSLLKTIGKADGQKKAPGMDFQKKAQEADAFSQTMQKIHADINSLGDLTKKVFSGDSEAFSQFKAESDEIIERLEALKSTMTESGADTSSVQSMLDSFIKYRDQVTSFGGQMGGDAMSDGLQTATNSLEAFQQKWQEMPTLSGIIQNAFTNTFSRISSAVDRVKSGLTTVGYAVTTGVQNPLQALDRIFAGVAGGASKVVSVLATIGKGAVISGLYGAAKATGKVLSHLRSMISGSIIGGLKKLASNLTGIGRSSKGASASLKKGLRTILKYGLGIRSLYILFRKLRSIVTEGLGEMAKADPEFAQVYNGFKNALATLKNSFVAALAPIAEVVLPLLTKFINYLTIGMTKIGMLVAALTGKNSFMAAAAQQKDYTAETNNSTKATKKNTKAQKENQKTIASFDDVNILKDNKDSSESEPAAFQQTPIDPAMMDLAKKLKDMWKNGDFTELGKKLGESLKSLLDSIPWDKIRKVANKLGKSLATFLNGFMEVPGLFRSIGRTIAQAINTMFEFLNGFVSNLHWDSLGKAIRDLILGFADNLDWGLIYDTMRKLGTGVGEALENAFDNPEVWTAIFNTIAKGFNSILYLLDSFLQAIDWGSLGQNIATGLNNGIETINWELLGQTIVDAFNALFDLWYNFVTTFDFTKFGTHIGETLSKVIREVNWTEGGASLAETINGIFDALNGFITSTDWGALGKAVIDVIAGFFGNLDWSNFGEFISGCIIALYNFFTGAIQEIDWSTLPGKIVQAIIDFFMGVNWAGIALSVGQLLAAAFGALWDAFPGLVEALFKLAGFIIGGLLNGITIALAAIGEWIYEHVFAPIVDALRTVFGSSSSPSKDILEIGKDLIGGMLKGIVDALASIGDWVYQHIFIPFMDGIKTAFGIASPSKEMDTIGGFIIEGLLNGITSKLSGIHNWLQAHVTDPICNGVKDLFGISSPSTVFKEYGGYLTAGLEQGIDDGKSDVTTTLSGLGDDMKSKFNDISWSDLGENVASGISTGISGCIENLKTTAWNMAVDMYNSACKALGIASPSKKFAWIGDMMTAGLAEGIDATQDTAISAVTSLADAVTEEAETAQPTMLIDASIAEIDGVLSNFSDKVVRSFDAMVAAMEAIVNGSAFTMPAVAGGSVMPYSARRTSQAGDREDLSSLIEMLSVGESERITRADLIEILTTMFRDYMHFDFRIGDEQIARHANAGNAKLDRRYNPVKR